MSFQTSDIFRLNIGYAEILCDPYKIVNFAYKEKADSLERR